MAYKIEIKEEDRNERTEEHLLEGNIIKAIGRFSRRKLDSGNWSKYYPKYLTLVLKPDLTFSEGGFKIWNTSDFDYKPSVKKLEGGKIPEAIRSLYEFEKIFGKEAPKNTELRSCDITVPVKLEIYAKTIIPYLGINNFVKIMESYAEKKWKEEAPMLDSIYEILERADSKQQLEYYFSDLVVPWMGGLRHIDEIILNHLNPS